MGIKQTVALAVATLLAGLLVGFLMWGRPLQQSLDDLESQKIRRAEQAARAESEIKRIKEELNTEREHRQKLEEMLSRGRK